MAENRCPLIENCQQKSAVCNVQLPDETCYWFRWFRALDNPWHTGTPTEATIYLCFSHRDGYFVSFFEKSNNKWLDDAEVEAWQKITPYEGEKE